MKIDDIESEALRLTADERARLASFLIASLDELSREEWLELWTREAVRRDEEMDRGDADALPADKVFGTIEAGLK